MSEAHPQPHPSTPGDQPSTSAPDQSRQVAERIEDLPPSDGAAVLQDLPADQSAGVAEYLDPETAAHILAEMDPPAAAHVITDMQPPEASVVLAHMNPDDRVDVLEHVPEALHETLLREMPPKDAANVRRLEEYPPDTAGGIMTTEVTALPENLTVERAIAALRRLSEQLEQVYYVYVVDAQRHLRGVLSMRDLIMARGDRRIGEIMKSSVASVPASMDQEEVARLFRRHHYLAMPVIDNRSRLLGIITVDDVVDVIEEETTEDVQRLFGAGAEERLTSPWQFSFRKRLGWLIVNLATAYLAAFVVGLFESTIQKLTILAAYMPIVAGMGGNASAQAMSVAIRGIAVGRTDRRLLLQVLRREVIIGFLTGLITGLLTAMIAYLFHFDAILGLVIALALTVNLLLACSSGAAIPFIMNWLGFDPAQSATIVATTVTDVVGFFALLGLARLLLP